MLMDMTSVRLLTEHWVSTDSLVLWRERIVGRTLGLVEGVVMH
jgi:hypothetical protein